MSGGRRGAPVRQLSLQPQSARRPLRRQSSEELGLRVLGVGPGAEDRPRAPRPATAAAAAHRPRPARLAWAERRPADTEVGGLVAQRCRGQPRPTPSRPARPAQPDSILYSRHQLAERLRLAWKDRRERPNLDIFLAHSVERTEEEVAVHNVRDILTEVEKNNLNPEEPLRFSPLSDVANTTGFRSMEREARPHPQFTVSSVQSFPTDTFPLAAFDEAGRLTEASPVRRPKLTPSITISLDRPAHPDPEPDPVAPDNDAEDVRCDHLLRPPDSYTRLHDNDQTVVDHRSPSLKLNLDDSCEEEIQSKEKEEVKELEKPKQELSASARRANFRNSGSNAIMSSSLSVSTPPCTPAVAPVARPPASPSPASQAAPRRPGLPRMMSAPAAGRPPLKPRECDDSDEEEAIIQRERGLRSASAAGRRRTRGAVVGRRRGGRGAEDESSEEELDEPLPTQPQAKPKPRKRFVEKGDIVTMVSLLSPNDSEVDDEPDPVPVPVTLVAAPPAESTWCRVGAEPRGTEPRPASASAAHAQAEQGIVSLRKLPVKTVSFQQGGVAARPYTASYPSRRGAGLLALPPEPPPPPTPPTLGAAAPLPPGSRRPRMVKAKTISCDSEPPPEASEAPASVPLPSPPSLTLGRTLAPSAAHELDQDADPDAEPVFQTPKERECWQMFRKMADKGVTISYDTVLRGMLTPTEYRLHKKALSTAC